MDETKRETDMGTIVPDTVAELVQAVKYGFLKLDADMELYYTGGCLCEHETQDYDILVQSKLVKQDFVDVFKQIYLKETGISEIRYNTSYERNGLFTTGITVWYRGHKIDFLFFDVQVSTLHDVLNSFPLSIQMQAIHYENSHLVLRSTKFSHDPIIIYVRGISEEKYRKYYPDKEFKVDLNAITPISRPILRCAPDVVNITL